MKDRLSSKTALPRKGREPVAGTTLAGCILGILMSATSAMAADSVGTVVSVSGGALLRSGSADPSRGIRPVRVNEKIFEGDVINTSSSGKVKILLVDKTILDIAGGSLFNVKKFSGTGRDRNVELELPYGQVRTAVTQPVGDKGNYRLRSTAATMGVRGTEFVVASALGDPTAISRMERGAPVSAPAAGSAEAAQSVVTVVQGKVEVAPQVAPPSIGGMRAPASASPVMLTAGTQLLASTAPLSAPSAPTSLNTEQLRNVTESARVVDNTFRNTVELDLTGERKAEQDRLEQNTGGGSSSSQKTASSGGSSGSAARSGEGGGEGDSRAPASAGGSDEGGSGSSEASSETASSSSSDSSGQDSSGASGEAASDSGAGDSGSASSTASASSDGAGGGASAGSSASSAPSTGGVANFTASLITSTVAAPPPTVAEIVMPAAVVTQSTSSGTSSGGFAGSISASQGITAPPVAVQEVGGGSKRITVIIKR